MRTTKKTTNAITSLPPSPDEERHGRMIRYSLAMFIRLVCVIVAFLIPFGWWTALPAVGAIVLPYVAVVLATVGSEGPQGQVVRPGGVEIYRPEQGVPGYEGQDPRDRPFTGASGEPTSPGPHRP
ncbi:MULTISPECIES: DUF3099 domain-containing protein [unclassified Frondihabitans]|uniref:DUF3099 domain-containing protein n=1 Tax=unclassified Frondihabitans TaxID=2626248 RepID=UPI0009FE9900|nr:MULTISPECIES: DUF3099 domain-containing protein [unclassified Frondihabitans]RPE75027.1 DUF3099 family protein [Frondihabitans sp. PhB153]RPF04271.1 DUF3099 family protein [Frondihabitans sp. PhB161]